MKKLLVIALCLFWGCSEKQKPQVNLEEAVTQMQEGKTINASQQIKDDAQILIDRAKTYGYTLLNTKALKEMLEKQTLILIDTSSRADYLLYHIPDAKSFTFDASFLASTGELQWDERKNQAMFQKKLGTDLSAPIVFYAHADKTNGQISSADIGAMWAKKMGYQNVYRLVGGATNWKEKGYPVNAEAPSCCQ